ncbi:hypothetical protein J6590_087228 [Homalodisca vitripennis]|nr:hypothetical protein J6590_087228 [Homalodisca vitripennis]
MSEDHDACFESLVVVILVKGFRKMIRKFRDCEATVLANILIHFVQKVITDERWPTTPVFIVNVTQDVIALHSEQRCDPPRSLPPPGPLIRSKLRVGDLAYTMKVSYFSIWVLCRVLEVIPRVATENDSSTETYRVRLENVKKTQARVVTGKYLAYHNPSRVQLKVGTRVIAIFREEEELPGTKSNYYVGVIAEPPKSTNKYRQVAESTVPVSKIQLHLLRSNDLLGLRVVHHSSHYL